MKQDSDRFDTSDYPENNIFGIKQLNNKIPGKMKDEATGDIGCEFFGVRSKVYLYETVKKILAKKIKGINTQLVKASITKEDFRKCLLEDEKKYIHQYNIKSNFHNTITERQTKLALSANDDKRFIIPGTTCTLAHEHKKIKEYQ